MATEIPVKYYKLTQVPLTWEPNAFYAIQIAGDLFEFYLVAENGVPHKAGLIRKTVTISIGSVGAGESNVGVMDIGKTYIIERAQFNEASSGRIRLYQTAAQRNLDIAREFGDETLRGTEHGLILDLLLNDSTGYDWKTSPIAMGMNGDSPLSTQSYWTFTNLTGGVLSDLQVTLTALILG